MIFMWAPSAGSRGRSSPLSPAWFAPVFPSPVPSSGGGRERSLPVSGFDGIALNILIFADNHLYAQDFPDIYSFNYFGLYNRYRLRQNIELGFCQLYACRSREGFLGPAKLRQNERH